MNERQQDAKPSRSLWGLLSSYLNYDFCPNANRYVYWLKQPIGWFVLATAASMLVGIYVNSRAWPIAGGLVGVIVLGLLFPWLAVRLSTVSLRPQWTECREGEDTILILTIKNRLPIPIWGLFIERYFTTPLPPAAFGEVDKSLELQRVEDTGLACVPSWSQASYHLPVTPEFRGSYPADKVYVSCAFPFGIWKARQQVIQVESLIVRPSEIEIRSDIEWTGRRLTGVGTGRRSGGTGEYLGVRPFRRGDSLKSVHWVQTARTGDLVVCERSQPTEQTVALKLSLERSLGNALESRRNLAWKVRITASIARLLSEKHTTFRLLMNPLDENSRSPSSRSSKTTGSTHTLRQALDLLTNLPLDAFIKSNEVPLDSQLANPSTQQAAGTSCLITIASMDELKRPLPSNNVCISYQQAPSKGTSSGIQCSRVLDLEHDLSYQISKFFEEAVDA